jgi:hypothetical protein
MQVCEIKDGYCEIMKSDVDLAILVQLREKRDHECKHLALSLIMSQQPNTGKTQK